MKTIKILVSVSEEAQSEREALERLIKRVNAQLRQGVKFAPVFTSRKAGGGIFGESLEDGEEDGAQMALAVVSHPLEEGEDATGGLPPEVKAMHLFVGADLNDDRATAIPGRWAKSSGGVAGISIYSDAADLQKRVREVLDREASRASDDEPGAVASYAPRWTSGSPYPGLAPLEFEQEAVFFGRDKIIDEGVENLRRGAESGKGILLVTGVSGCGKSSLIRAGIVPRITSEGVAPEVDLWRRGQCDLKEGGSDLFLALANALCGPEALPELTLDGTSEDSVSEMIRDNPNSIGILIKGALSMVAKELEIKEERAQLPKARLILLVDHLESIFSRAEIGKQETTDFFVALHALAKSQLVWLVSALRADSVDACNQNTGFAEMNQGLVPLQLLPPSSMEIGQIIRQSALASGVEFEEDDQTGVRLDNLLRDSAGRDPASLPLLAHFLSVLYEQKGDDELITFEAYYATGGFEHVVVEQAENVFQNLSHAAQEAFPSVMRSLVTVSLSEDEKVVRRLALLDDVRKQPAAREFVDRLIDGRLLVAGNRQNRRPGVLIAHDCLINDWPRSQKFLSEEREFLAARAKIDIAQRDWRGAGRAPDYLLMGEGPLNIARGFLENRAGDFNREEEEYLKDSITANASLARVGVKRKLKLLGVFAAAGIAVAVILALTGKELENAGASEAAATVERDTERTARLEAEAAREAAERFAGQILQEAHLGVSPPEGGSALARVAEPGMEYLENTAFDPREPEDIFTRAVGLFALGEALGAKGKTAESLKALQRAKSILEPIATGRYADPLWTHTLASIQERVGLTLIDDGRWDEGMRQVNAGLARKARVVDEAPEERAWRLALARGYMRTGEINLSNGLSENARTAYLKGFEIEAGLVEERSDNTDEQVRLLGSLKGFTERMGSAGYKYDALALSAEYVDRAAVLYRDAPDRSGYLHGYFEALTMRAVLLAESGDLEASTEAYEEQSRLLIVAIESDRGGETATGQLGTVYVNLARVDLAREDFRSALARAEEALEICRATVASTPWVFEAHAALASAYQIEGEAHYGLGNPRASLEALTEGIKARTRILARDPENPDWQAEIARNFVLRGRAHFALGDFETAVQVLPKGIARTEALLAGKQMSEDSHRSMIVDARLTAEAMGNLKRWAESLEFHEREVALRESAGHETSFGMEAREGLVPLYRKIVAILLDQRRKVEALPNYLKLLTFLEDPEQNYPSSPDVEEEGLDLYRRITEIYFLVDQPLNALQYLEKEQGILERRADDSPEDLDTVVALTDVYEKIAGIHRRADNPEESLVFYRKAVEALAILNREGMLEEDEQALLADYYSSLGAYWFQERDLDQAELSYSDSLQIMEVLVAEDPDRKDWQFKIADLYNRFGEILMAREDSGAASRFFEKGLQVDENLTLHDPGNDQMQFLLAQLYTNLGISQASNPDFESVFNLYNQALEVSEVLVEGDPENREYVRQINLIYGHLGDLYSGHQRYEDAISVFRRQLERSKIFSEEDPDNLEDRHNLALNHMKIGENLVATGQYVDALEFLKTAAVLSESMAEENRGDPRFRSDLAIINRNMGDVYGAIGDFDNALCFYGEGRRLGSALSTDYPENLGWLLYLSRLFNKIGDLNSLQGNTARAIDGYKESIATLTRLTDLNPSLVDLSKDRILMFKKIGDLHAQQSKWEDALNYYTNRLNLVQDLLALDPQDLSLQEEFYLANNSVAEIYGREGNLEEGLDYFLSAHGILQTIITRNPERTSLVWNLAGLNNQIGILLLDMDRSGEARDYFRQSVEILEPLVEQDPKNVQIRLDLVGAYLNTISSFNDEDRDENRAEVVQFFNQASGFLDKMQVESGLTPEQRSAVRNMLEIHRRFFEILSN